MEEILMDHSIAWENLGKQLRVDSIRASSAAGSGHPTSSMSAADLITVLLCKYLKYDFSEPQNPNNDHLIFSKGHASPLLYSAYKAAGVISDEQLLSFRKFGSPFQGHPTPALKWVDVATGSLGQGLPIAVGVALSGKYLDRLPYRTWVLCGDSEMSEGSVWEAFEQAAFSKLDNLTVIIDVNRLGQRGETMHGWNLSAYSERARAFGWHAIEVDGHDLTQIDLAYKQAINHQGKPTVIIARTVKGSGVTSVEDKDGFHGKALEDPESAIAELGGITNFTVDVSPPDIDSNPYEFEVGAGIPPLYSLGDKVATRKAYGDSVSALGQIRNDVVVLDAEVNNSTFSDTFKKSFPDRYFEMYIAEQQMVASAIGMQVRKWIPFASTFAAFLSRAYDFVRMAAVSRANICLIGSHAGVSIGQDGPSQMALEDISSMRAVHGSTVLYPSDANQTAKLVPQMADRGGVVYMRTTREATPVIYSSDEEFMIGGSNVVYSSDEDQITIIAAGITVHEAIKAIDKLASDEVKIRLIDIYSIKPIDRKTLEDAASVTDYFITVEDHWMEGGLGDAVVDVFANNDLNPQIHKLAVSDMPASGSPSELLNAAGIDSESIVGQVKRILSS